MRRGAICGLGGQPAPNTLKRGHQAASVLVGLLWCVAILSVVVIGVLQTARLNLLVVKNHGDLIQAHYLALAGIEKAKALLYLDVKERQRSVGNHSGELYDAPQHFRDVSLGRGQFRVFHEGRSDEGGGILYGVADEESRLNLNQASAEELGKLSGMTPDVVAALLDWRDPDNEVTPGGAETDYYVSLQPPGLPRNGPLQTTRELLMVRGLPRDLFLGEDANQNGLLDPEEDDGNDSFPPDNHDGLLDAGWSGLVTVDSAVQNKNAAGEDRINVQTADEKTLASVKGISAALAKAIVAYRDQNQLDTLADLLDVAAVNTSANPLDPLQSAQTSSTSPNPSSGSSSTPSSSSSSTPSSSSSSTRSSASSSTRSGANRTGSQTSGPKLVSENLLMDIADDLMAGNASEEHPGAVNINTASPEVLACLPGVTPDLAQAIIAYRRSAGFFPNIAWLLKVDGMNRDIFKQMAPRVCARSETFRILSEGRIPSTGARKRLQVIVQLGAGEFTTLSWREDL
jgi:competence ComEA-like helix-hairpin-helix protein